MAAWGWRFLAVSPSEVAEELVRGGDRGFKPSLGAGGCQERSKVERGGSRGLIGVAPGTRKWQRYPKLTWWEERSRCVSQEAFRILERA
jgi:hypothetical protein